MPRIAKLDSKTVAGLTLPDGRTEDIYFDARLPGHGLRLRRRKPGGPVHCTWITQYATSDGRKPRVTHGDLGKLTAAQAYEASRQILAKVALGNDPQGDKIRHRRAATRTFRVVVDEYLMARTSELRPMSLRVATLYLTGPYFRSLHPLPISNVTHADVAACIRTIEHEHSSHTAAAARRALSTLFGWAIGEALMGSNPVNPVIGTRTPAKAPARDRVLSIDELMAVWRACEDDDYGRIIRLLILTGARAGEVGGICWSELDLDAGTWNLPKERSKNGRAHTLPLMPMAMDIIKSVPRMASRDQLFGERAGQFTSWARNKPSLDRTSGVTEPWTVHDLRRTTATGLGNIGVVPHIVEEILNHQSGHKRGIASVYNKSSYGREVKQALGLWEDHLRSLVDGGERRVLPFTPAEAAL
jgi:integrase